MRLSFNSIKFYSEIETINDNKGNIVNIVEKMVQNIKDIERKSIQTVQQFENIKYN